MDGGGIGKVGYDDGVRVKGGYVKREENRKLVHGKRRRLERTVLGNGERNVLMLGKCVKCCLVRPSAASLLQKRVQENVDPATNSLR